MTEADCDEKYGSDAVEGCDLKVIKTKKAPSHLNGTEPLTALTAVYRSVISLWRGTSIFITLHATR